MQRAQEQTHSDTHHAPYSYYKQTTMLTKLKPKVWSSLYTHTHLNTLSSPLHSDGIHGSPLLKVSAGLVPCSYLSKMSWLDVAVAPSSPSAALPTAAAAPLPASMILTHCNEQLAREAEREG